MPSLLPFDEDTVFSSFLHWWGPCNALVPSLDKKTACDPFLPQGVFQVFGFLFPFFSFSSRIRDLGSPGSRPSGAVRVWVLAAVDLD